MKKLFILLFLIAFAAKSYSCDCSEKPSIKENWELANQVFIGKVIKVDSLLYGTYGEKVYSFTIKIKKSFKGEIFSGRDYRTILYVDTAACDFRFAIGYEYLIYAKGNDKMLHSSLCSRTALLSAVSEDEFTALSNLQKDDIRNRSEFKIIKLQNNTEYQIDLVKDSFKESLKRKNLTIYILLGLSFLLFLILIFVWRKKNKKL